MRDLVDPLCGAFVVVFGVNAHALLQGHRQLH
jgi:hypothetical protein